MCSSGTECSARDPYSAMILQHRDPGEHTTSKFCVILRVQAYPEQEKQKNKQANKNNPNQNFLKEKEGQPEPIKHHY